MSLFEFFQFLLPSFQVSLSSRLLSSGHVVEDWPNQIREAKKVGSGSGTYQRCIAPANGNHSDVLAHSLPKNEGGLAFWCDRRPRQTHIHHVVKDHERSSLRFCVVPNTYLSYTTIPTEKIVQVVPCDIVGQIFNEEYPVRAWRKLALVKKRVKRNPPGPLR